MKINRGSLGKLAASAARLVTLVLAALICAPAVSFGASSGPPALIIYHTNDVHGYAFHDKDKDGNPIRWGYDYVKSYVDKDPAYNKLLLDAGDSLSGHVFANARRGELVARMLSMIHYDAIVAGNHDFDYGWERLLSLRDTNGLNFISANVRENLDNRNIMLSFVTRNFPNLKVGVIGISTPSTPETTDPRNVMSLTFESLEGTIKIAKDIVRRLREKEEADMVIALTHLGDESSGVLAREVPGIDLIIDGHDYGNQNNLRTGNAVIATASPRLVNLGRIEAYRLPGGSFDFKVSLLPAPESERITPKPELSSALDGLRDDLNLELATIVARTPVPLDGASERIRRGSTNLGRLVCAALMSSTRADAAILNSGTIKASIPMGEVTAGELLSVIPYENYAITVNITGRGLLEMLNDAMSRPGTGAFPQFYGMTVKARKYDTKRQRGAYEAVSVTIGGEPLDENVVYKVAINDVMYRGGYGYEAFAKCPYREYGSMGDIFKEFLSNAEIETISQIDKTTVLTEE